jgi:hypothetical protein
MRLWLIAGALLTAALGAAAWLFWLRPSPEPEEVVDPRHLWFAVT